MKTRSKTRGPRPPFSIVECAQHVQHDQTNGEITSASHSPLKWAGGKRWLICELRTVIPKKFDWYIEPFAGGASVFFSLAPQKAVLADLNGELIATYRAIQVASDAVWRALGIHASQHSTEYYYQVRQQQPTRAAEIAARFLYLNRTCWNGLFRVNLRGYFNVPRGTKDQVLLPTDSPSKFASILQSAELYWSDFEMLVDGAGKGDLIYADPPYTVKHNLNGFLKYNESIFSWADQERLAESLRAARSRGAFVIVSNADHDSVRQLYEKDFQVKRVKRSSIIAGQARFRAATSELLIVGEPKITIRSASSNSHLQNDTHRRAHK